MNAPLPLTDLPQPRLMCCMPPPLNPPDAAVAVAVPAPDMAAIFALAVVVAIALHHLRRRARGRS